MSRILHKTCSAGVTGLRFIYANFDNDNDENIDDITNLGTMTLTASIEYPAGTFTQVTFNGGSSSVSIPVGGIVESDDITISLPGASLFYERNFLTMVSGQIPTGVTLLAASNEGREVAASGLIDKTMSGTVTTSSAQTYGAMAILGYPKDRNLRSFVFINDSSVEGKGDNNPGAPKGYMERIFSGVAGYCNMGITGAQLANWNSGIDPVYRIPLLQRIRPTHAFINAPNNDLLAGASLATMQAISIATWTQILRMGIIPWALTIPPHSTSTDSWATVGNQTVDPTMLAIRNAYNAWVIALPAPLVGVFDINQTLENSPNTDAKWVVNGSANYATTDGGHPTPALHAAVAAAFTNKSQFSLFV